MGAFFHAVAVFGHHLAEVRWAPLAIALVCHVVKLLFRARAWQNIVAASYPQSRLRFRSAFGAYVAGVGVNSIVPARGGDVVKLYLVRHRLPESTYATLAPTLVVETIFDAVVGGAILIWALTLGVLPTHQVYSRLPSVDWKFFVRHEEGTLIGLLVAVLVGIVAFTLAERRLRAFHDRVRRGFAILGEPKRFVRGVLTLQAVSWVLRVATLYFFLEAFRVHASIHNALLALVVDSLSTLFPATPGGAGTKQGLIVLVFRRQAISETLLLAFSVGMNIAVTVANVVLGLLAIGLMAGTFSFKRLRHASVQDKREQAAR